MSVSSLEQIFLNNFRSLENILSRKSKLGVSYDRLTAWFYHYNTPQLFQKFLIHEMKCKYYKLRTDSQDRVIRRISSLSGPTQLYTPEEFVAVNKHSRISDTI